MSKAIFVWDGTQFVPANVPVAAVPNAVAVYNSASPTNAQVGTTWFDTNSQMLKIWSGSSWIESPNIYSQSDLFKETMTLALSDETTAISAGTSKLVFRAPYAMILTSIPRASLSTASSSGLVTIDINVSGSSILSTKLTIDANEKTSLTAASPAVLSNTSISDDSEITFDIDAAGTSATGLKVTLYYKRA